MNGAYSKNKFDNPNYCALLMIFQKLKFKTLPTPFNGFF